MLGGYIIDRPRWLYINRLSSYIEEGLGLGGHIYRIRLGGYTIDRPRWPYINRLGGYIGEEEELGLGGHTAETLDLAYLATEQLAREPIKKRPDWSGIQLNMKHIAVRS